MTDRWLEDGRTYARNNNVALAHPYYNREMMKQVWLNSAKWLWRRKRDGQMDGRRTHGK